MAIPLFFQFSQIFLFRFFAPSMICLQEHGPGQCGVASMFVLFCFLHLFLLLPSLTPISGCCESEGAIKTETQTSQP